tara:strand:- start:562 stop:1395 length:834 start_codon:yes stop_codon:yes gene_type:complete
MIRKPVVSGSFYPENPDELVQMIQNCFMHKFGPNSKPPKKSQEKIFGVICPHAGYMYSGPIASHSYYEISSQGFDLVIIIGPNHLAIGSEVATMSDAKWQTPLGISEVDSESSDYLTSIADSVEQDYFSHSKDHSLEVQIPFLQETFSNNLKILPIIMTKQDMDTAIEIGNAIAEIAKSKKTMIIGSSDFTHYEENDFAHKQDMSLIEPILQMDITKFYEILSEKRISACGYGAIAATMIACKNMGSKKGELLAYATSGDIVGSKESVVGYASIKFV